MGKLLCRRIQLQNPVCDHHGCVRRDDVNVIGLDRNLTVNLGMRFEDIGETYEKNGLPRELHLDQPGGYLFPTDPASKAVVSFYPSTVRLWPRLGLAYRPGEKWVVRFGGGVYNNVDQMNNLTVVSNPLMLICEFMPGQFQEK